MTIEATPGGATPIAGVPHGIDRLTLEPGLRPGDLADMLGFMPETVDGLTRRDVTTAADSATLVYLAGEDEPLPRFGMVVILVIAPAADAAATVSTIQRARWGPPEEHTVTGEGPGTDGTPAYREFWRVFPPGLFAIPNQPVYFLIAYRADDEYAYMVIGGSPPIRQAIAEALVSTLDPVDGTPTASARVSAG